MNFIFKACRLITILVMVLFLSMCASPEYPEFQKIKKVKVLSLKSNKVKIGANVQINNPNALGGVVTDSDLDITLMEKHKANVKQIERVEIPAADNFEIPIEFEFSPKDIWKDDLLGTALTILGNKKVKAHIKGTITVELAGYEVDVPLDVIRDIPLKKKKK